MLEEKEKKAKVAEKKSNNNTVSIDFEIQELQVIINLLDIAVRARGLDVAANAAIIHEKIKSSINSNLN